VHDGDRQRRQRVPPLSAAMAGSFQSVICLVKIRAMVCGCRLTVSTPSRLNAIAIGEM
jgi:hypothetical protein